MSDVKVIVRYLPQFHTVPENDKWWGKGFTDWRSASNAESLFSGHKQPRVPQNNNYYNLLEKKTMQWQADLALKYGIAGFAFYHYWFKDGKRLLEKPAENLLKWTDINMPFCFSWANETWARTWSKLTNTVSWNDLEETGAADDEDGENGILLDQRYGKETDWIEHINYMIPFFKDPRYIRKDEHPVLIIYKPDDIACLPDMLDVWNRELGKNGIEELFVIGETFHEEPLTKSIDAIMVRFPTYGIDLTRPLMKDGVRCYDYDEMWQSLLKTDWNRYSKRKVYLCPFVDYDTTPRKGRKGDVVIGFTMEKWRRYIQDAITLSRRNGNEFLFINAWNEWGETMYMEPDEENHEEVLAAVREALTYKGDSIYIEMDDTDILKRENEFKKRFRALKKREMTLQKWMSLRDKGVSVIDWLVDNGMQNIAIYGAGLMGEHLLEEALRRDTINVRYFIDRGDIARRYPVPIIKPDVVNSGSGIDTVVVTIIEAYDDIRNELVKRGVATVSLEHIINEL